MPTHLFPAGQRQSASSLRTELLRLWHGLWRDCTDRYRPELHYMRGPGPRWREKHQEALA
jgi:hypothetical protein